MKSVIYITKPSHMKPLLFLLFFSLATMSVFAQDVSRIEVKGKIIVDVDDVENITVYDFK